jgi:DGQHR domain-containing protein
MEIEADRRVELNCLEVTQPLGTFFLAIVSHEVLREITYFDVRRMLKEREFETYLGIQRPLNDKRVAEIQKYVRTSDACFPTNVILSVPARCAEYSNGKLCLRNDPSPIESMEPIYYRNIAKVLDGQHRIEGLQGFDGKTFDVPVCIFIDIDVADEAYLFSTVNLAQTKVQKSLVYDLYELAHSRSPQKTAHNVAVVLDRTESSPFFHRIKRLGSATPGRLGETITQATFVECLLPHLSSDAVLDRDIYKRGRKIALPNADESRKHVLRIFFARGEDEKIVDVLWAYFDAVGKRWPDAWKSGGTGVILNRTNGIRALMRFFAPAYNFLAGPGEIIKTDQFLTLFSKVRLKDSDFTVDQFKPGSSGEALLFNQFVAMGLR